MNAGAKNLAFRFGYKSLAIPVFVVMTDLQSGAPLALTGGGAEAGAPIGDALFGPVVSSHEQFMITRLPTVFSLQARPRKLKP